MTDEAPLTVAPRIDMAPIRWRRWLVVLAMLIPVSGWIAYLCSSARRVAADITAAGGVYVGPQFMEYVEYPLFWMTGGKPSRNGDHVALVGEAFDDAWVADHNDLRELTIDHLAVDHTRLSRDAVMRILANQTPTILSVSGVALTDADAEYIGQLPKITVLNVMGSDITDAGLHALHPLQLRFLNVAGTNVTAAGLQTELAGSKLHCLSIDGHQFTPELAAQLAQMPTCTMMTLVGPDVTETHLQQLVSLPGLKMVSLYETSLSDDFIAALRTAKPNLKINVVNPVKSAR